ncbi:MAG: GGDEF domain-containing protein [Oscillospiraceae bacterium]|nr:GGDEF domain-containing protein [Oscillospiraceae bacterium]
MVKSFIESLKLRLESLLDNNYLFDKDHKLKSNMQMFLLFLIGTSLVNAIGILSQGIAYSTLLESLLPISLCIVTLWAVGRIESLRFSMLLAAGMMLLCMWTQLYFSNSGFFGVMCILLYPMAICIFLGNYFSIPFLFILFFNLGVYFTPMFNVWRSNLNVIREFDSSLRSQFLIAFIFSAFFGFAVAYIYNRTNLHLAAFAKQVAENSFKDPLTSLLTRRAFYERFSDDIISMAQNDSTPVFLIMCDVDHFKAVNDTYGHAVGDEILKHTSKVLLQYSLGRNLCFRWGGEEFIMFMSEKSLEKAVATANRIRVVLEHSPYIDPDVGNIKATMSFGVHRFDKALTLDKNISVVDEYLYAAKRNGRNRVESALERE